MHMLRYALPLPQMSTHAARRRQPQLPTPVVLRTSGQQPRSGCRPTCCEARRWTTRRTPSRCVWDVVRRMESRQVFVTGSRRAHGVCPHVTPCRYAHTPQVEYVELLLHHVELKQLKRKAPALAVVSSPSAVTLTAASTDAQVARTAKAIAQAELKLELGPAAAAEWRKSAVTITSGTETPLLPDFAAALARLKQREVSR